MNATSIFSARRRSGRSFCASSSTTSYPTDRSAFAHAAPERSETSRSTDIPPNNTATRFVFSSSLVNAICVPSTGLPLFAVDEDADAFHFRMQLHAELVPHARLRQGDQ